jgi:hypothetical protein
LDGKPYDIVVDSVGMNWEQAGPLFDRYTVALTGRIDRRWVACYNRSVGASETYARFRLDPGASNVSFTTRSTDGPVQVMSVIKKLESLVASVNKQANQDLALEKQPRASNESGEAPAKPRLSGLAARLGLARDVGEPSK